MAPGRSNDADHDPTPPAEVLTLFFEIEDSEHRKDVELEFPVSNAHSANHAFELTGTSGALQEGSTS